MTLPLDMHGRLKRTYRIHGRHLEVTISWTSPIIEPVDEGYVDTFGGAEYRTGDIGVASFKITFVSVYSYRRSIWDSAISSRLCKILYDHVMKDKSIYRHILDEYFKEEHDGL